MRTPTGQSSCPGISRLLLGKIWASGDFLTVTKNIRQAFEEAERTNSILLFDEADSFFADRNNAQHIWERRIRFMNQDKVNSSVITKELIDLQKEKKNGSFCQKMGF